MNSKTFARWREAKKVTQTTTNICTCSSLDLPKSTDKISYYVTNRTYNYVTYRTHNYVTYIKRHWMSLILGSFLSNITLLYNRFKLFILLSFSTTTHNKIKIGMSYEKLIFKHMYIKFSKNWEIYGKTYMIWPSSTEYIHCSQRFVSPGTAVTKVLFHSCTLSSVLCQESSVLANCGHTCFWKQASHTRQRYRWKLQLSFETIFSAIKT
jgi:hypothetical protein